MKLPKVDIKKILYTTDLSDNARLAFSYAVSLANLYGARMTILHVISEDPDLDEKVIGYISAEKWQEIKDRHYQEARQTLTGKQRGGLAIKDVLNRFCDSARAEGCDIEADEILVKRGEPVVEILATAEGEASDLVVMGSHGYGTLKDAMMGGTARRVLRRAKVPVLLVRLSEMT